MDLRVIFILAAMGIVHCEIISSCRHTEIFVNGHNSRRRQLARGEVSGQPGASNMAFVVWDDEIATKAKNWAANNAYRHNPDRSLPSGRFTVGENIYYYGTTNKNFEFDPDLALEGWWNEFKDYHYKPLSKDDFTSSKQIGHYTQMAWDKTTRIGCGISRYYEGRWMNFLVVCNYGPIGNYLGETPYNSDNGASGELVCKEADCSQKYGESC